MDSYMVTAYIHQISPDFWHFVSVTMTIETFTNFLFGSVHYTILCQFLNTRLSFLIISQ